MSHSLISPLVTRNRSQTPSPWRAPRHPWGQFRPTALWIYTALLVLTPLLAATPAEAGMGLTLRVNDVKGMPGEVIAVEVRTYAPRGVGQGQICLRASDLLSTSSSASFRPGTDREAALLGEGTEGSRELVASSALRTLAREAKTDLRPLRALEGVAVLSALGDAVSGSSFDVSTQTADVDFLSPSATINEADGPLAIFYFRLDDDLKPDQEFLLAIDPGGTYIVDALGNHMPLELKPGRLRIQEPTNCTP